jgi:hypothetical protein
MIINDSVYIYICNEEPWSRATEKPVAAQIKPQKWKWIGQRGEEFLCRVETSFDLETPRTT